MRLSLEARDRQSIEAHLKGGQRKVELGSPRLAGQHRPCVGPRSGGDDVARNQVGGPRARSQVNEEVHQCAYRAVQDVGPRAFIYQTKVSIYLPDGQKVYKVGHSCTVGFGDAMPISVATGTVDNVRQLEQMSNAEIQEVFEGAAKQCGEELVVRMRKHAS